MLNTGCKSELNFYLNTLQLETGLVINKSVKKLSLFGLCF